MSIRIFEIDLPVDCTEEQQVKWKKEADGRCESCGHIRKS